jgi:hypothetical protein
MSPVRMGTTTKAKGIRMRALALIAAVALLTLSLGVGVASAHGRGDHGTAENTFTKYVTTWPAMAGVVGGDVGAGSFAGEVLKATFGTATTPTVLEALYHFNGSKHSFTALVHVVQSGSTNGSKAVIIGVVTDGWLEGNLVQGKYTQIACPQVTCYQGRLDILRGSGD